MVDIKQLEGRKFCCVFVQIKDEEAPEQTTFMRAIHGRANVDDRGGLVVETARGPIPVPRSCHHMIQPNDGTALLEGAEYFVLCKVDKGLDL